MRAIPFLLCLAALLLTACDQTPPLSEADKIKFVEESLIKRADCDALRQKLGKSPANAVFEEAKKASCIKRDI